MVVLSGHYTAFLPQTQTLEPPLTMKHFINRTTRKYCLIAFRSYHKILSTDSKARSVRTNQLWYNIINSTTGKYVYTGQEDPIE